MTAVRSYDSAPLTQCHLCKDFYNLPKLLSCLHSFCEECLCVTENIVICPICSQATPVADGVKSLKTNQFLLKLTGNISSIGRSISSGQPIVCTSCDNDEAFNFCHDCGDCLCNDCKDAHSRVRLARNHLIYNICDIRNGQCDIAHVARTSTEECTRHDGEVIRFFCKTCGYLICRDCLLCDNHLKEDHECVCVRDVVSSFKDELEKALESVQEKKRELVKASEAVESLLDEIERVVSEEESRVNLNAVQRIRAIEEERERQLKLIRSKKSEHVKDLSHVLEEIDNGVRNVTDLTSLSKNLVELGQARDILDLKNQVITRANELAAAVSVPKIPFHLNNITFSVIKDQAEPVKSADKATQLTQNVSDVAEIKISVQSIGTSTDDLEVLDENKRLEDNADVADKITDEVTVIQDNMCDVIRSFVIDVVTRLIAEHDGCPDDVISSVKDVLELKFGPSWHVVAGNFSFKITPLNLDYAVLVIGNIQMVVFCSGSDNVSKQTLDRKVIVVETDMVDTMKRDVLKFSKQAMSRYRNRSDIAKNIAEVFRRKYGGKWQCFIISKSSIVGLSKLPIATNSCIHFTIGPEILMLLKLSSR